MWDEHLSSVSEGSGLSLRAAVQVQTQPLNRRLNLLPMNLNYQLRYILIANCPHSWVGWAISRSPISSIYKSKLGSCFGSVLILANLTSVSTINNVVLPSLQFARSMNLDSVFFGWYIVHLTSKAAHTTVLYMKIGEIWKFPNSQDGTLPMLNWHGFSQFGREHVSLVCACIGCQNLMNGSLKPIRT